MRLVLASGSPRRRELLERLGLDFDVVPPDVDATRRPDGPPAVAVASTPNVANSVAKIRQSLIR